MSNIFIHLAMHAKEYFFVCNDKVIPYDSSMHVEHEHGKYLVVRCEECCNVPVYHLLERK